MNWDAADILNNNLLGVHIDAAHVTVEQTAHLQGNGNVCCSTSSIANGAAQHFRPYTGTSYFGHIHYCMVLIITIDTAGIAAGRLNGTAAAGPNDDSNDSDDVDDANSDNADRDIIDLISDSDSV